MHTIFERWGSLSPSSRPSRNQARFAGSPGEVCRNLLDLLLVWQERAAQRRALTQMDRHMLKDIGISRAAALDEARKPFWRI